MKIVIILAAIAFVAIMATDAEDNALSREERSAIGGKRPGPNIRKKRLNKKKRKQGKKANKKGKNGKLDRKVKKKSGSINGKSSRKVKAKLGDRQCDDDSIAKKLQQIDSWKAAIKNTQNIYNNLVDKVSLNGTIKESLSKYMTEAMDVIGAVTINGTNCSEDCPSEACAAYDTLSNCPTTARVHVKSLKLCWMAS